MADALSTTPSDRLIRCKIGVICETEFSLLFVKLIVECFSVANEKFWCLQVWCRFNFFLNDEWHESKKISDSMNFHINLEKMFPVYPVTKEVRSEDLLILGSANHWCDESNPIRYENTH